MREFEPPHFRPASIPHYDSVQASVSRAMRRLEARGLIVRIKGVGADLTDSGARLAAELTDNQGE